MSISEIDIKEQVTSSVVSGQTYGIPHTPASELHKREYEQRVDIHEIAPLANFLAATALNPLTGERERIFSNERLAEIADESRAFPVTLADAVTVAAVSHAQDMVNPKDVRYSASNLPLHGTFPLTRE